MGHKGKLLPRIDKRILTCAQGNGRGIKGPKNDVSPRAEDPEIPRVEDSAVSFLRCRGTRTVTGTTTTFCLSGRNCVS